MSSLVMFGAQNIRCGMGMINLHVRRPHGAHDWCNHIRQARLFRGFISLVLVTAFDLRVRLNIP